MINIYQFLFYDNITFVFDVDFLVSRLKYLT